MIPKWTPVSITWLDAHTDYDDRDSCDYEKMYQKAIRRTIGWLIHQDKERVVLAMDDDRGVTGLNDCQTVTTLPIQMIQDITVFKPVKPTKPKPKK